MRVSNPGTPQDGFTDMQISYNIGSLLRLCPSADSASAPCEGCGDRVLTG